jgi:hypothetical protein
VRDDDLLLLLNADAEPRELTLPGQPPSGWSLALDTARPGVENGNEIFEGGASLAVAGRSLILLTGTSQSM